MYQSICALILAGTLCACSSSGGLVDESEEYAGPPTAAVAPVSDRRGQPGLSDEELCANVQRGIQRQLDRSGIFATVVTLEQPDEGNEAEVIIEPILVGSTGYGRDQADLRVRVTEKTKRRIVFDQQYPGDDRSTTLKVAIRELEDDLGDRYKR